ncbi:glycosyl hydrolase family 18 protein [Plantactinospora sp. KLBMP9567]|uniref:glycosyl hydrolase family 18 protein n=1 Tax=Plantactinospora sp. KLBMP9567 TaxID=3085900 RepID=UPI002981C86A|nr:glycosyl hydrolase family 18 protein [Plantactinospora sp. KLBMP9567]MDW5325087.1 glycosyl hydrolase family 18 protein [Plantactinospora sp. KLBMP9567]MDW5329288.1 glycosyl hydrolase family 18 protein [Plantactinospora sp. KLBMP9567]
MSPTLSAERVRPPGRRPGIRSRLFTGALALATAATGTAVALAPLSSAEAVVLPNNFKSVGYLPSWAGDVNAIQYNKLTHINYAFVLPNANGTLRAVENPSKLSSLVSRAHSGNVKVSIAIGGWNNGDDSAFEALASNASSRTTFVNSVISFVTQYNLDGVDMDWEYPDPGTSANNFTALMQQLSGQLRSRGKLLTAAVVSEGGTVNGVQPAVFGYVDWLNIMAYDGGSPHANYDWSINAVNGWKSRGLPASKAVLGVPFYSRPGYYTYSALVAMDPANANRDCTTAGGAQQCYNGIPTVKRKTQWALANAGGMMNWELSQDTNNATSLVSAIYDTVMGGGTPPPSGRTGQITGIGGKCVDVAAASTANGTAIQLYACNGSDAQRWTVGTDGTLRALGKCADITAAATTNGAKVQLYDCNGTGAQVWQAQSNGTLRNPASNKCLDATDNSSADGTRLQIWDCFGGANQVWRLPA